MAAVVRLGCGADTGSVIETVHFSGSDNITADLYMRPGAGANNRSMTNKELISSIIEYCRSQKIPMAQGYEKTLSRTKTGFALDMKIGAAKANGQAA